METYRPTVKRAEVKTHYEITFTETTLGAIASDYREALEENKLEHVLYMEAFTSDGVQEEVYDHRWFKKHKDEEVVEEFKRAFGHIWKGETYTYLARKLGFDDWDRAPLWSEEKKEFSFVVYKNGDALND